MPILPIYSSTFGQMGIGIDGVAPPPYAVFGSGGIRENKFSIFGLSLQNRRFNQIPLIPTGSPCSGHSDNSKQHLPHSVCWVSGGIRGRRIQRIHLRYLR